MEPKNVHQKRAELIKELNFLWHSPALDDQSRMAVIAELEKLLHELREKAVPR